MERKSNIDIIKGLAIILMVYGHTFGVAHDFIYLFHMPVFIFISGYCVNSNHSKDIPSLEHHFFTRVKRLLVPYWIYNICFVICNNLFIRLNFYTDNYAFKLDVAFIQKAAQSLAQHLGLKDTALAIYQVITFELIPQMGSASWFLVVLFIVCVIHLVLQFIANHIKNTYLKKIYWVGIFLINVGLAQAISGGFASDAPIASYHLQIFEVYTCFLLGVFFRTIEASKDFADGFNVSRAFTILKNNKLFAILAGLISFCLLLLMQNAGTLEMSKMYIVNAVFLVFATIFGMLFLNAFAMAFDNTVIGNGLIVLGKHTLPILFLHILSFKFVSYIYCMIMKKPYYMVASWPVLFDVSEIVKICYTIVGLLLPLLAVAVVERVKKSFTLNSPK